MNICVVGLGYVGLPLAVAFGKKVHVRAFDINEKRVAELKEGFDRTNEVSSEELKVADIEYSTVPSIISDCDFIIIAVPTPIDKAKNPNLRPLIGASTSVGKHLKVGSIVVYESTVYPGCTEEDCVPILEKESGLTCGVDFKVGYSPERINPGDKEHTLSKIVKVVSGMDAATLDTVAKTYEMIIEAGVHRAPTIKSAEAAKVIENTQRDINIALMNELLVIFDKLGIKTRDVLEAAGTKWNFLKFHPGLVGGHCIGVDPYYLAHKASLVGHHPDLILAGRRINDDMPIYFAQKIIRKILDSGKHLQEVKIAILGVTFKPDVPDTRNSKIGGVIEELKKFGLHVAAHDPMVEEGVIENEFSVESLSKEDLAGFDVVIVNSEHKIFSKYDFSGKTVLRLYE